MNLAWWGLQILQCLATPAVCDPQPGTLILQLSTQAHSSAFCFAFGLPWEALNTSEIIIVKLSGLLVQGQPDKEDHGAACPPLHPQRQYNLGENSPCTFTDGKREVVPMGVHTEKAGLLSVWIAELPPAPSTAAAHSRLIK